MNAAGIDVSSRKSTVAVLRPFGEVVKLPFDVTHSAEGLAALVQQLKSIEGETRVVMEHTGRYYEPVAQALHTAGFYVSAVNPLLIKEYGGNSLRRVKTDKADAMKIARYALDNWSELRDYTPMEELCGATHIPAQREPVHLEGTPAYQVGNHVVLPAPDQEISGTIGYIGELEVRIDTGPYAWSHQTVNRNQFEEWLRQDEHNVGLFRPEAREAAEPKFTTETVASYSKKFRAEHEADILLHQAAKRAFDELNVKKLPKMKDLQAEYAALLAEKKAAYADYRRSREEMRELLAIKANVDQIMGRDGRDSAQEKEHGQR